MKRKQTFVIVALGRWCFEEFFGNSEGSGTPTIAWVVPLVSCLFFGIPKKKHNFLVYLLGSIPWGYNASGKLLPTTSRLRLLSSPPWWKHPVQDWGLKIFLVFQFGKMGFNLETPWRFLLDHGHLTLWDGDQWDFAIWCHAARTFWHATKDQLVRPVSKHHAGHVC